MRQDLQQLVGEITRFGLTGIMNTLVSLAVIFGLMIFGLDLYIANACGFAFGVSTSFFLNKNWTFSGSNNHKERIITKFLMAVLISYLANIAVVSLLIRSGENHYLSQTLGMPVYTITFFLLSKLVVFRARTMNA